MGLSFNLAIMANFSISGHIADIPNKRFFDGILHVENGRILKVIAADSVADQFILPGFIDSHVHIESSMLVPSEFARMAVVHGTVATISDPHEIGNVLGIRGVDYMIRNGSQVPFKFYFGAPSCVPATGFETAGAIIDLADINALMDRGEIRYLAEMMNWPGVLARDTEVMAKIDAALRRGKVVDGHAPGLTGEKARSYASAGITTDHECFTREEALFKLQHGMKILVREGSAARNFDALISLLRDYPDRMMFCSDDKHPDSLETGHINELVKRAIQSGFDVFDVLKAACINPIVHYGLGVGMLRETDPADFIVTDNLENLRILKTYINGMCVAGNGETRISSVPIQIENNFKGRSIAPEDFKVTCTGSQMRVIEALDGQLITNELITAPKASDGFAVADVPRDLLKVAVINRYNDAPAAVAFIKGFGLKEGALASSVAHDSHNIIVVGVSDESMASAANMIMEHGGGVSASSKASRSVVPLPVAGLMSASDGYQVAREYKAIDEMAKSMGSTLGSPFMTLSFMALLVIPALKLSDKGLFDGNRFRFTSLFIN
jgi:adenine deaminase